MSGRTNDDFARDLVAAARREEADEATKMRVFARVATDLREAAMATTTDAMNERAAADGSAGVAAARAKERAVAASDGAHPADARDAMRDEAWFRAKEVRKLRLVSAVAGAMLAAAGAFGLYMKRESDEQSAKAASAAQQQADLQGQLSSLNAQLSVQSDRVDAAQAALANAKDESARLAAQAQLAAAQTAVQQTRASFSKVRPASSGQRVNAAAACTCNHSDPLCGCL